MIKLTTHLHLTPSFRPIGETEGSVLCNDALNYVFIESLIGESNKNLK